MTTTRRSRITAGLLAGLLAGAVPATLASGVASAAGTSTTPASHPTCTASDVGTARSYVEQALAARSQLLATLVADVDGTSGQGLTAADRATLLGDLQQTEIPGIAALQQKVPGDTTCAALYVDAKAMVDQYRVYMVMAPQVHLTIAADDVAAVDAIVTGAEPTIASVIAAEQAAGKDVSGAQVAFNDLKNQVAAASSAVNGLAATVLAQAPAGAPGNVGVFQSAKASLSTARSDLQAARTDLTTIVKDLRP